KTAAFTNIRHSRRGLPRRTRRLFSADTGHRPGPRAVARPPSPATRRPAHPVVAVRSANETDQAGDLEASARSTSTRSAIADRIWTPWQLSTVIRPSFYTDGSVWSGACA